MDPVIIFSFLSHTEGNAVKYEEIQILANCSHFYAKKNVGFKTVLYTDKTGFELLKHIPYDEIILFDDNLISQFPKKVWSAGKILAFSLEKRPFIHIDFDFFIFNKDFLSIIENAPFFAYHDEPWTAYLGKDGTFNKNGVKIILEVINERLNLDIDKEYISVNFSMFGSCQENSIPIINETSKKMIDCIIQHANFLNSNDLLKQLNKSFGRIDSIMIPLIIEQVFLMEMFKKELKEYKTCIKIPYPQYSYTEGLKLGLLHLWDRKQNMQFMNKLNLINKSIINRYSN
jgi:hypothetical protein